MRRLAFEDGQESHLKKLMIPWRQLIYFSEYCPSLISAVVPSTPESMASSAPEARFDLKPGELSDRQLRKLLASYSTVMTSMASKRIKRKNKICVLPESCDRDRLLDCAIQPGIASLYKTLDEAV